jgi:hypothetical protein
MEPTPTAVVERLLSLSKIEVTESGCWISLYSTGSHGYSQIGWNCREPEACGVRIHMALGHRLSWEHTNGPIPDRMTIDHICKIRRCINPEHLRLLSNLDNARDNGGVRSEPTPVGKKCGKGLHELLRYPSGAVACRECANERNQRKDVKNLNCTICGKEMGSSRTRRHHERTQH